MELTWAGRDITPYVTITGCVHRDASHGRSDSLELTLDHASTWYRWGPEEDDEIRVTHDRDDTGVMYLNAIIPTGDQFRVLATSLPRAAARKTWGSYRKTTLEKIFESCGAECRMGGKLYGIDGKLEYPYLLRENEGCAAFLNRIGNWEGVAVKALNGAFRGIAVNYAQERKAEMEITIRANQEGVTYKRRDNMKFTGLTVRTPWATATARDTAAKGNNAPVLTHLPAMNAVQAGRWARGLLLMCNRQAEEITLEIGLNTRLTAMTRVDIDGNTDMSGRWIVDTAEHDLFHKTSSVRLLRVIDTIL